MGGQQVPALGAVWSLVDAARLTQRLYGFDTVGKTCYRDCQEIYWHIRHPHGPISNGDGANTVPTVTPTPGHAIVAFLISLGSRRTLTRDIGPWSQRWRTPRSTSRGSCTARLIATVANIQAAMGTSHHERVAAPHVVERVARQTTELSIVMILASQFLLEATIQSK